MGLWSECGTNLSCAMAPWKCHWVISPSLFHFIMYCFKMPLVYAGTDQHVSLLSEK